MKSLLCLALAVVATSQGFAVGNRVIDDLEQLKKIGFEFTNVRQSKEGAISFSFIAPSEYTFDSGGTEFTKRFSRLSYIKTLETIEHGAGLLGAPSSHFDLASHKREDARHESRITLLTSDTANCFFAASFSEGTGSWTMIIHIPVSNLLKQIQLAEQGGAGQSATRRESKQK